MLCLLNSNAGQGWILLIFPVTAVMMYLILGLVGEIHSDPDKFRIRKDRDEYWVEMRVRFLGIRYWKSGYINLFSEGDPTGFKDESTAKQKLQELMSYYKETSGVIKEAELY